MFKALAFSALLAGCAAVIKEDIAFSDGIKAVKSKSAKSDRVWMSFPEQLAFHKDAVNGQATWTESDIVREDTFWEVRGAALGLESGNTMKLVRSFTERSTQITFKTYQQSIQDIRVFGGEFVLAVGLHGGVLRANGLPLTVNTIASNLRLPDTTIGAFSALDEMKVYMREKVKSPTAEITELAPLQLVWHMSQAGNGKMGVVSKAYWVNGLSSTNHAFDIFVDAMGGGVLQYIDKSRKASPFSSPLPGDVKVYDESAGNTLVFSTTASPPPTYPTTDQEMNTLIDNTYYVKYYFQSISGGTFITWRGYESELRITYNLEIANAYFDGYSGIYFGTGYITDDVISHEWAHG
jgi:hypothetical protein